MDNKVIVTTENAPKAIGPYSAATRFGNLVFTAGQLGIDPQKRRAGARRGRSANTTRH